MSVLKEELIKKAYEELISYADHADLSVRQAYPVTWRLLQRLGVSQSKDDKDNPDSPIPEIRDSWFKE